MRLRPTILAGLFLAAIALPAIAEDQRTVDVRFDAGATGTTIADSITGREFVVYRIGAEAGQRMDILLETDSTSNYFNVYEPGRGPGDEALATGQLTGPLVPELNRFSAVLPTSGVYSVSVFLYRNAARRGDTAEYTLDISITGETGETVEGDFADGLQGGPDFWRVEASGGLKLHASPSTGAAVVTVLPNGLELRNLGCRMAEGRSWCRVATGGDPGIEGWAANEFLREAAGEGISQLPDMQPVPDGDALVPGTGFNATGSIPCVPDADAAMAECAFGVEREGNGNGWITATMPDGAELRLRFEDLTPAWFEDSGPWAGREMTVSHEGDTFFVNIGPTRLTIPLAVMAGG